VAIQEAQENTRRQLLAEMDELRNEAALEMSLQRHSYEDEIASLNRALEQQKATSLVSSPTPVVTATAKSAIWDDLEAILQDTERRLYQPSHVPQVNPLSVLRFSSTLWFLILISCQFFIIAIDVCHPVNVERSQYNLSAIRRTVQLQ
jgi:hypothetical protein